MSSRITPRAVADELVDVDELRRTLKADLLAFASRAPLSKLALQRPAPGLGETQQKLTSIGGLRPRLLGKIQQFGRLPG